MTTYLQILRRNRLINFLFAAISAMGLMAWAYELHHTLDSLAQRKEDFLSSHQKQLLERKGNEVRDLFDEIYRSTRMVSLLPMIRSVQGENRHSITEDVVAQGRFSLDAHRTMQQVYANLQNSVQLSEMYLVLDGFDPVRHVPFFMYDDLVARPSSAATAQAELGGDVPPEIEDEEYRHFPIQLKWFQQHAPIFAWTNALDKIPVQLSPMLRTCDNSQFVSLRQGNENDARGFIYAMPVYALDNGKFKGMVATILRTNVLEALLLGVTYVPVTPEDERKRVSTGWSMPEPSSFRLRQPDYGIDIHDRRNPVMAKEGATAVDGRWTKRQLDLKTGRNWELAHFLAADEIAQLTAPMARERLQIIAGRVFLLAILMGAALWNAIMMFRSRRELIEMAHFDPLTALPNRRLFLDQLQGGLARAQRDKRKLAVLFIDVNNFRAINDNYGNYGGDQLLRAIGDRLKHTVRGSDTVFILPNTVNELLPVARMGGDEFTVICEGIESADDIVALIQRLLEVMHVPFQIGDTGCEIGISIGVAVFPDDATEGDKLLICADKAMHECQREGHAYYVFNDELRQRSDRIRHLSLELKRALELGQFELFYQPKACLRDGHIVSLEALLRWRHPELGLVSPTEFISILEHNGQIIEVGEWVIEQSCRAIARLDAEGFNDVLISANVSVKQLRRGNLHETVAEILVKTGADPHRLVIEVTESMMMKNLEEGQQALQHLEDLGIKLAIDDFGTGYSSLTYLQHLPLTYLKLDKSFIDGMGIARGKHIVETVVHLAAGLSLKTIAEGIETVEQRDMLAEMGCDIIQGYLLSQPIPLSDIIVWLHEYQLSPPRPFGADETA